jgi:hypothetical protein
MMYSTCAQVCVHPVPESHYYSYIPVLLAIDTERYVLASETLLNTLGYENANMLISPDIDIRVALLPSRYP